MHAHEIINRVYDEFRGLPARMAELRGGKSAEWYRSWGRTPPKLDAYGTGYHSKLGEFLEWFDQNFVAASRPAANRLRQLLDGELARRIGDDCRPEFSQRELRRELLKEAAEAVAALDECELSEASDECLLRWETELAELADKACQARSCVIAARRLRAADRHRFLSKRA